MWRKQCCKGLGWLTVVGIVVGAGVPTRVLAERARVLADRVDSILLDDVQREPSERWIGVACTPVGPALRTHLGLPEDQGLLVMHVVPDSPAAKAELKDNDILLKADDKPLGDAEALVAAVRESDGKAIALELIRAGKRMSLSVEPAERPAKQDTAPVPEAKPYIEWLRPWLDNPEILGRIPLRLRRIAPGLLWSGQVLPDGVSVTITEEGKKPVRITIKEGDQTWESTLDQLDDLPEKVQRYVADVLGRVGAFPFDVQVLPDVERQLPRGLKGRFWQSEKPHAERSRKPRPAPEEFERRLEKIERQLKKLTEAIGPAEDQDPADHEGENEDP